MDILQDFIKSLAKEELKSYKLYSKRTHNFENRKDIELFESIKKNSEESDVFHHHAIYKKTKPDTKYYRLKNKITDDLGVVLTNLNHRKPEIDVLHLLALAKIFNQKKQFKQLTTNSEQTPHADITPLPLTDIHQHTGFNPFTQLVNLLIC